MSQQSDKDPPRRAASQTKSSESSGAPKAAPKVQPKSQAIQKDNKGSAARTRSESPRLGRAAPTQEQKKRSAIDAPKGGADKLGPEIRKRTSVPVEKNKEAAPKRSVAKLALEKNVFTSLGKLKDLSEEQREALFVEKLNLCSTIYDFHIEGSAVQQSEKEGKRRTLLELADYINSLEAPLSDIATEELAKMVHANLFRALAIRDRDPLDIIDPEEDVPYLDPAWPHLEGVYEFLLRYVVCKQVNTKNAKSVINADSLAKLVNLLDSDDARERDYLKTLLQRIFMKFTGHRTLIRRTIQNACLKAAFENEMQNGVGEILDIMTQIIAGFKVPLKDEHADVLKKVLLPLHKVRTLTSFQHSLISCVKIFCSKDAKLTRDVISYLLWHWPNSMSMKEVCFLDELEELLDVIRTSEFQVLRTQIVKRIATCITSPHSDIAERAVALWENESIFKLFGNSENRPHIYPTIMRALFRSQKQHWNKQVHQKAGELLKKMLETDRDLFDTVMAESRKVNEDEQKRNAVRKRKWAILQNLHGKRGGAAAAAKRSQASSQKSNGSVKLSEKTPYPLSKARYGVGIYWDRVSSTIEPELQILAIGQKGDIVDACDCDRPRALKSSITQLGGTHEIGEIDYGGMARVKLSELDDRVKLLLVVVVAKPRGQLRDVPGLEMHLVDEAEGSVVARIGVGTVAASMGVVATIKRNSSATWSMARSQEFVKQGRHFMDILDPTLATIIQKQVPGALKGRQKVALPMEQSAILCLPSALCMRWSYVGVGWDIAMTESDGVGLDVSAVIFDDTGKELGAVNPLFREGHGLRHSASGVLGAGFVVEWDDVPKEASQIFIVGNIHEEEHNFQMVQSPTCRVIDRLGTEMARFSTREAGDRAGFIWVRLFRDEVRKRWSFQALGTCCDGRTWNESLPDIQELFHRVPHMMHQRQSSNGSAIPPRKPRIVSL